jgi:cytochrome P450
VSLFLDSLALTELVLSPVKANASENEKTKLNEDELLSQMRTIIMAGHESG